MPKIYSAESKTIQLSSDVFLAAAAFFLPFHSKSIPTGVQTQTEAPTVSAGY